SKTTIRKCRLGLVVPEAFSYSLYPFAPQHFLYFLPEPQGQGSLRPIFAAPRTTCCTGCKSPEPAMRACSNSRRFLRWKASSRSSTDVAILRGGRRPLPSVPPPDLRTGTPASGPPWPSGPTLGRPMVPESL